MYIFEDLIGYIFLASLLGIILTIIIGPFVYLTIYIRNKREEKAIELNNNLKREFTNKYQFRATQLSRAQKNVMQKIIIN